MTPQEAAALLQTKDNILILTHRRPDGDTTGCAAGLCAALRQAGKTAYVLPNPEFTDLVRVYAAPYLAPADFVPDFIVSVDIAAKEMFLPSALIYLDKIGLAIDHHTSFEFFGAANCVQPERAACGEIIYEICAALGEVTPAVALPLYVAVSTDTGCFVYANTTANTHAVAAALMATGIDYTTANKRHFRTKTRRRMALEAALLGEMEFFQEDRGVFLTIPLALRDRLALREDDLEDISSLANIIEGVDCGAVLRELSPDVWKLSLRTGANGRVDASQVCARLGGGGHAMAAGATIDGTLDQVKGKILAAVEAVAGT